MKRDKQCPKCESLKIGHVESLPDVYDPSAVIQHRPQHLGVTADEGKGIFHVSTAKVTGQLEAYICTECGYLETYVRSPDLVPFEKLVGFRWINEPPPAEGPFR